MKTPLNAVSGVIEMLLRAKASKATKYLSPNLVVRAVRKCYGNSFDGSNIEIVLTIGKPNYIERQFVKDCKKTKEPFPVKKIQIKLLASEHKKLSRK